MSWPDGERYLRPMQSLVVSLLLSLVSLLSFLGVEVKCLIKSSSTHRFPRFPSRNFCSLVALAVFSLRCDGHTLLLSSYLSRTDRINNSSCSACGDSSQGNSYFILHCPTTDSLCRLLFGDSLSLYDLWSKPWGVAQILELHGLPPCSHSSEGVG